MGYGRFKVLAEWGREMDTDPRESSLGKRGAGAGEGQKGPERLPTGGSRSSNQEGAAKARLAPPAIQCLNPCSLPPPHNLSDRWSPRLC